MDRIRFNYILLLFFLSLLLQLAGGEINHFVTEANHGTMPVWVFNEEMGESMVGDSDHSFLNSKSKYKPLCDIFPIMEVTPEGVVIGAEASIGDLFCYLGQIGCFLVVFFLAAYPFLRFWEWLKIKYHKTQGSDQ